MSQPREAVKQVAHPNILGSRIVLSEGQARALDVIEHNVYAGSAIASPEADVRYLLFLLRDLTLTPGQVAAYLHEHSEGEGTHDDCVDCASLDPLRMCHSCLLYMAEDQR